MYQLGWFSTGRGKGSRGLLKAAQDSIKSGELEAEIAFVFCSREPGESEATDMFLKMVEDYHIPLVSFSCRRFKLGRDISDTGQQESLPPWRFDYDREVMVRLQGFRPDLCVLAGYMLIVGREMCQRYNMINLHPAALGGPTGTWQEVIWQLIDNKSEEAGVMMHLVTPELDRGPPVTYCTFPINGESFARYWLELEKLPLNSSQRHSEENPLFKLIRSHGMAREFPLIIATVRAFSQGNVKVTTDKRVVDAGGRPINGYNLTEKIDWLVQGTIP